MENGKSQNHKNRQTRVGGTCGSLLTARQKHVPLAAHPFKDHGLS